MTKKETAQQKKIKDLLSQLSTKDPKTQLKAIKSLKIHGNETVIEPLVQVLAASTDESVKNEITDFLNTIKYTSVPAEVINCLANDTYANAHHALLVSIWSSGLDYRPYLGEIANATVKGGLMEAIECITIFENIEGSLDEDQIMDALLVFKSYLVDEKDGDSSKNELIKEIVLLLQNLNDTV